MNKKGNQVLTKFNLPFQSPLKEEIRLQLSHVSISSQYPIKQTFRTTISFRPSTQQHNIYEIKTALDPITPRQNKINPCCLK